MKTRVKRSMSAIIIALCMLVQLIPALPAQAAGTAGNVSITFKDSQYRYGIDGEETRFNGNVRSQIATLDTAGWAYNSEKTSDSVETSESTGLGYPWGARAGFEPGNVTFALDIKVNPGTYKVDMALSNFGEATYPLDIVVDGKTIATGVAMGNAVTVSEYVIITSDEGYATVEFTDTSIHPNETRYFCMESISFAVVESLPAENASVTFTGSSYCYGIESGKVTDFASHVPTAIATLDTAGWAYNGEKTSDAVAESKYTGLGSPWGARAGFENGQETFALNIKLNPGKYKVDMALSNFGEKAYPLDIAVDGNAIATGIEMGNAVTVSEYVEVTSNDGYATLKFTDTSNHTGSIRFFCLQSVAFTVVESLPAKDVSVTFTGSSYCYGIESGKATDFSAHVPETVATLSGANWAYNGEETSGAVAESKYTGLGSPWGARAGFENGQETFALNIKLNPGKYKVDMALSNFGEATYPLDITVDGKTIATGVAMGNAVTVSKYVEVTSNDGYATLKFTDTSSHTGTVRFFCLQSVKFTVVDSIPDPIPAIFGDTYAYIRETKEAGKSTYKLVLVGAINSIDYKQVGFCINGETYSDPSTGTTRVYKKITDKSGSEYTAESFGLTESGFIFYREIDVTEADGAIEFWAYAIGTDGTTVTEGGKRTISEPIKAAE